MKDFVKIQYSVMQKLRFDQSYYWNQGKRVFKERVYSCQWTTDFAASGDHFFLQFSETPASFFPSSGKVFFKEILIFRYWKRFLELIIVSTNRKKAVNKRIVFRQTETLIPPAKMKDSLKFYVSTTRKSCFHRQEYLKKPVKMVSNNRREVTL